MARYGVYAVLVVLIVWLAGSSWQARATAREQREDLTHHVIFLCSTTDVLDDLVVAAAESIRLNLRNGTYARLVEQGVLTAADVAAARAARARYEGAHALLSSTQPCAEVEG